MLTTSFFSAAITAIAMNCSGATPASAPAPAPDHHAETGGAAMEGKTIATLATETEDLSTLLAAVKAAGLVDTLNGDTELTVFAPTNAAFGKLPEGTVETLVKPENKEILTGILTYHVVAGEVKAADLVAAIESSDGHYTIETVNGGTLTASIVDGAPVLTDAKGGTSKIIATDVDASNGVVHLIDTVVMPQ